jgi:hypothetical protein
MKAAHQNQLAQRQASASEGTALGRVAGGLARAMRAGLNPRTYMIWRSRGAKEGAGAGGGDEDGYVFLALLYIHIYVYTYIHIYIYIYI